MLISTEIGSLREKLGDDKKIIQLLKNSGFTAYDFSMSSAQYAMEFLKDDGFYEYVKDIRAFADSIGIVCNQTHAPFPTIKPNDDEYNKFMLELIKRSIKASALLGAKICVVHPCNTFSPEENIPLYRDLLPTAKEVGIKIATENMWGRDYVKNTLAPAANSDHVSFKKHMDLLSELDKDVFVACVDIGHCNLEGLNTSPVETLTALGDYVQCIHLHDNDKSCDMHVLPFTSKMDYAPVIQALKDINYKGDVTLEAVHFLHRVPNELIPSFIKLYADVAIWFKNQLEK